MEGKVATSLQRGSLSEAKEQGRRGQLEATKQRKQRDRVIGTSTPSVILLHCNNQMSHIVMLYRTLVSYQQKHCVNHKE